MARICATCGKPITFGCMTDDTGDFYTHIDKCFEKYMDKTYGKHRWMEKGDGEGDEYGGYYLASSEAVGGYQGTGIYYTEFEEDDDNV